MKRRDFLHQGLGASAFFLLPKTAKSSSVRAADSRIEVLFEEPLGTISPNIYGHFAENLGGVLYDGIWVGEKSPVPNINGLRKELIEHLRKIKAPVIRYPGGCFADSYDWRDGIGPAEKRPRRTNFWANDETDAAPASHQLRPEPGWNQRICALLQTDRRRAVSGSECRSQPASSFYQWVEYCNSPAGSTTLGRHTRRRPAMPILFT